MFSPGKGVKMPIARKTETAIRGALYKVYTYICNRQYDRNVISINIIYWCRVCVWVRQWEAQIRRTMGAARETTIVCDKIAIRPNTLPTRRFSAETNTVTVRRTTSWFAVCESAF
jgi:hypothetical protein